MSIEFRISAELDDEDDDFAPFLRRSPTVFHLPLLSQENISLPSTEFGTTAEPDDGDDDFAPYVQRVLLYFIRICHPKRAAASRAGSLAPPQRAKTLTISTHPYCQGMQLYLPEKKRPILKEVLNWLRNNEPESETVNVPTLQS